MYLKVIQHDDTLTEVIAGVERVEFYRLKDTVKNIRGTAAHHDLSLISCGFYDEVNDDNPTQVGCFMVISTAGKRQSIIFDGVAFLCNETGKAVERFVAN